MKSFDKENIKLEGSNLLKPVRNRKDSYCHTGITPFIRKESLFVDSLVTFTEAASELKERTALFIRKALKEAAVSIEGFGRR
jgi:hypothetical protein